MQFLSSNNNLLLFLLHLFSFSNSLNIFFVFAINKSYISSEYWLYMGTLLSTKSTVYSLGIGLLVISRYESSNDSE